MARKHPFHWDTYNAIYDRLDKVIDTEDRRLHPEVRKALVRARAEVYRAWDLQASLERAENGRFGARPSSDDQSYEVKLAAALEAQARREMAYEPSLGGIGENE